VATLLDHSYGMAAEVTYNTPVTVSRHVEALVGSGHDWDPNVLQGQGLRVGSRFLRSGRRLGAVGKGKLTVEVEAVAKGLGLILEQAFGTATSTLVSSATYQQVFTPAPVSGSYNKSCTWQVGVVKTDGNVDAYTYAGCTARSIEIACPEGGIATIKTEWDARSLATATGYVSPTYPSGTVNLFTFASGTATTAGTLTVPTTTALGSVSGGTATAVRSFDLTVDNGIDDSRWVLGGRNQPTTGMRKGTLKLGVEYDATTGATLRDALINQTAFTVVLTLTGGALGTGNETLQICLPAVMIDSGAIPDPKDDKTVVTELQCAVLDNLSAAQPIYVAVRTADTAL